MKKLVLFAFLSLFIVKTNAQLKLIAEGPVFEESKEGFAKLIQMKNGNTMFIDITPKKGINIRLYNAAHAEVADLNTETSYGKLGRYAAIEAAFELNGNVALMISDIESSTPVLYRLIFDGKTGALKDDKQILQLNKVGFGGGYAIAFGGVPMPGFYVRKDPDSDNYAIAMFNSFESERSKRIEIVTYGSNNQEVSRAYYASPEEKYKYLQYVDMAVLGSEKVCVLAYAYNTKRSGGKESELILANLDKGEKTVSFTELGFSHDLKIDHGLTRFNPVTKSLVLLALVTVKDKGSEKDFAAKLAFINPYEKKLISVNDISPSDRLNQYSKKGFTGVPQNLYINNDGSFTVVSEEMSTNTYSSTSYTAVKTTLGDVTVANYSKSGQFVSDYIMRKSQSLSGEYLKPFYLSRRQGTAQKLFEGNQFKSFAYINGKDKNYIVFNDTERNNDKQESGNLVTVSGVSESDGFEYLLKGTDAVPKRDYIFGNPESKRDHNLGLFAISDYNPNTNIYATLKLENEGGKKGVKVVWLQP